MNNSTVHKNRRPNQFKVNMGKRIKKIRMDNHKTIEAFAEELEVSVNAVSKWQRGICSPDVENLAIISIKYNVSLDYIITGKERGDDQKSSPLQVLNSGVGGIREPRRKKGSQDLFCLRLPSLTLGTLGSLLVRIPPKKNKAIQNKS